MSYYDIAVNIITNSGFLNEDLSDEEFITKLYKGLLDVEIDDSLLDRYRNDLIRYDLNHIILNSEEFKIKSANFYQNIPNKNIELSEARNDMVRIYGIQFLFSGFEIEFNSEKVKDGDHSIYIYAHSPIFGWDYEIVDIYASN